jgi:outer membrane protein assembly factor BamA
MPLAEPFGCNLTLPEAQTRPAQAALRLAQLDFGADEAHFIHFWTSSAGTAKFLPVLPPLCYSCPIMKRSFFLLLAVFAFAFTQPAAAQKFLPKTIQFKGAPEYSDEELLAAAGLQKGTVLAFDDMKAHSQKLMDTGVFETLAFRFDGVDLVYTLVMHTELFPVRLENLPLTPGKELDAALHERIPLYHGKVPAEKGLEEQVRKAFEEMLAAKGIKVAVKAAPYTDPKLEQVTAINYAITDLPVRVGEIHLEGVSPEMQDKAKAVADNATKTDYETENTAGNIERAFTSIYIDEGYANIKVHAERLDHPIAGSKAIEIPFHVTIEEGRHYKLGTIHSPSSEPLNLAEINKAAGAISYKSGNLSETLSVKEGVTLQTALLYIIGQYTSKGYLDCVVTPHPQYDDAAGVVNYTLEVQPGPVYTMGKLIIQNTAEDLRAAMLVAWKMPQGAAFSEKAIHDYYSTQSDKTPLGRTFASALCKYNLTKNVDTHTVDVTLRLERNN